MNAKNGGSGEATIEKEIKEEIISKVQAGERVADLAEQYAVGSFLAAARGEVW